MNETKIKKSISAVKRFLLLDRLGNGTASEAIILWLSIVPFIDYVSGAMLFLAVAGAIVFNKKALKTVVSDKKAFLLCCFISGFSMLSSIISGNLIGIAISIGIGCFLLIALYLKETVTARSFRKSTVVISVGSVVSMLAALFQKKFIFPDGDLYRPTAGAFNANYFGAITVMTILIAIVRLFDGEETEQEHKWYEPTKFYWIFIISANIISLLISESRSSLLSLTVCVIVFLFLKRRYVSSGIAVLGGGGIWLIGWMYPDVFSWTNSLSFIFTERAVIWENAFKSFSQNAYTALMGRGPMSYYFVMEEEGLFAANHAHNLLLDSLINVGLIGTVLYAAFAVFALRVTLKKRKDGDSGGFILSVLIITQVLVQGLADVTIMWHQCAALAGIMLMGKYKLNKEIVSDK